MRRHLHPNNGGNQPAGALFAFCSLLDSLRRFGDSLAVIEVCGDELRQSTFQSLAEDAERISTALLKAGCHAEEPIGLFAPNSSRWIAAWLGIAAAGCTAVAIDDLAGAEEAGMIVGSSRMRRLFTTTAHKGLLRQLSFDTPLELVLLDADDENANRRSWRSFAEALPGRLPVVSSEGASMLVYTSGTTSRPKAFHLRHRHVEANVQAIAALGLIGPGDRLLMPLPLHHVYPLVVGTLVPLAVGATVVLPEAASAPKIVHALTRADCTAMIGVPRLYEAMVEGLGTQARARGWLTGRLFAAMLASSIAARRHFGIYLGRYLFHEVHRRLGPNLTLMVSAGAKLSGDVIWKLEGLGFHVLSGYGLAETASAFTGNIPGRQRIGSEGRPFGDGQVCIGDADASGCGEIRLKGANVFEGYIDNPEADAAAFTTDGWFRTGDLGTIDADGFVYVTGRQKEMIVLGGGKNVFPEDLEVHYGQPPSIREIAVLERQGALVAIVAPDTDAIRAAGANAMHDVIRVALASAARVLPSHQRLSGFALSRAPLPRTRLGKYQRFLLPELYEQALAGAGRLPEPPLSEDDRALLVNPRAAAAWKVLQTRYGERGLSLDANPQLDLGFDSLEWLSLGLELEATLGVALDEQEFAEIEDVRSLLRLIDGKQSCAAAETATVAGERTEQDAAVWLAPTTGGERLFGRVLDGLNRLIAAVYFRLRVSGLEHLPTPPFVIVANHVSDLDPMVVAASLPFRLLQHLYWSGIRSRLFDRPWKRAFCRVARIFPVDERAPGRTLAMAERVLAQGNVLVWFPESWRSPDGELQAFRAGIGRLLDRRPVTVVPAFIRGTFEAMPRDQHWPRPHPVHVAFGPAVPAESLPRDGNDDERFTCIAQALRAHVAALAAERPLTPDTGTP